MGEFSPLIEMKGLSALFLVPTLLQLCPLVVGHGNMVFPYAWWDVHQSGSFWDEKGRETELGCGVLDLPDNEFEHHDGHFQADCMMFWLSNKVEMPSSQHAVLPEYMSQPEVTCTGQAGHHDDKKRFPWHAPGTTEIFGSCGTLGGGHCGNHHDGHGNFGDCCSDHCDSFANGKNAEEYDWPEPPVTEWRAGSVHEVAWYCSANHAGGYSYRLCRIDHDNIESISEECFQQNPLDFVGDSQMVQYAKDRTSGHRTEIPALQTTQGTFPAGSMWRANPLLPHMEHGGSSDYGHGHIYDQVRVPEHLQPGEYVLSFRWDSKCSPQVWTACANIEVV